MVDALIEDDLLKEQYPHFARDQFHQLVQQTLAVEKEEVLSEKSQYFFQNSNAVSKKKRLKP